MQTTDGQNPWEKHNNVNEYTQRLEKQAALSDGPGPVETEWIRK